MSVTADPATTSGLEHAAAEDAPRPTDRWQRIAFWVAAVASVASIVIAGVLAIVHDWVPLGDHAVFAIRARDVFSSHPPLLGTWTSASLATGVNVNNPGPLYYDALAVPTWLIGSAGAGVAVGVALVNTVCGIGVGWVARRQGGHVIGAIAYAIVAVLAWSLGSEVLLDPTQPGAMVFPALVLFMLVWGVARGDVVLLPLLVAVASLVLQTYITYVYLIGILSVWAVVALIVNLRRSDAAAGEPRRVKRFVVIALVVGAVCWAQPVWQQLFGPGRGNFGQLLRAAGQPQQPVGFATGTRAIADVLTRPPFWFRPAYRDFLARAAAPSSSLAFALIALAVVVGVLVLLVVVGRRRGDRVIESAAATGLALLVGAVATASRIPVSPVFKAADAHVFRWLWPLSAFIVFVVVVALVRLVMPARRAVIAGGVAAAIALTFACVNLPSSNQGSSALDEWAPVVRDLRDQLSVLEGRGPVVADLPFRRLYDPYPASTLAILQGYGIPFYVIHDEGTLYQIGFQHRLDGHSPRLRLEILEGDGYDAAPPGARRVAVHLGLGPKERAEMARLRARLASAIEDGRLRRNGSGAPLVTGDGPTAASDFVASPSFADLVGRGAVARDDPWHSVATRYLDLHSRWREATVAIYATPVPARAGT